MADNRLIPYKPLPPPQIEGGDRAYIKRELENIEKSIESLRRALCALLPP